MEGERRGWKEFFCKGVDEGERRRLKGKRRVWKRRVRGCGSGRKRVEGEIKGVEREWKGR